jgi:quinol-cytochrome oxidoreductase complex cytochrome b subunit
MNKLLLRICLSDAVYFSAASFVIVWLTNFLYEYLEKTTGKISMSAALIIVFSIILIMFFLTVIDLLLREPEKGRIRFWERILAILLFMIVSAIILGVLGVLFWVQV